MGGRGASSGLATKAGAAAEKICRYLCLKAASEMA